MNKIPKTSKAAVMDEYGKPLVMRDIPIPDVDRRAILVKNEMAGICGSDVHMWHGLIAIPAPLPRIMGHETVGRIVKLGEGRSSDVAGQPLNEGDRIVWGQVDCNDCYFCSVAHQPTMCLNRKWYGVNCVEHYPHLMGGFAEFSYILPDGQVVKVPDEVKNEEVLGSGCALRTSVHGLVRLGGLLPQENVVVLGSGPVGLYSTIIAKTGGAGIVITIGAPKQRLALARKWGADHTINIEEKPDHKERVKEVQDLTGGIGPDVVIEASGAIDAFPQGIDIVRRGGRYLIIGQSSSGKKIPIEPSLIVYKQLDIIGFLSADISHFYRSVQFVKNFRKKYPLGDIVSSRWRLDQTTEALQAMASGQEIKPVIDFSL